MRKRSFSLLGLITAILMLVGCGVPAGSEPAQLAFETQMQVDSAQRFHVSLGVRNVGQSTASVVPDDEREYCALQSLVDLARVNLAQKLGVEPEAVAVQSIEDAEFPDASLGIPKPGQIYVQVLTPGYTIRLVVEGQVNEYRASDRRLVFVPPEHQAPQGSITIEGVQVTAGRQIVVHGRSTLPEGTCLGSELWADGMLQTWWPGDACVTVESGAWQMALRLGTSARLVSLPDTHEIYGVLAMGYPRFRFRNWPQRNPANVTWVEAA